MRNIISYIGRKKKRLAKFILVSGSAVLINLLLLHLMVRYLGMNSALGENIANIISMELGIIYNFFLSRAITWQDRQREYGRRLFVQLVKFQVAIGITILMRVGLFALLQWLGVFYLVNAAIGIALAAGFNFVMYDTLVFKRRA
ncbi:GtrA family protein [Chloroflexota bacterium]